MKISDCKNARVKQVFKDGAVYVCCDGVSSFDDSYCLKPFLEVDYTEMEDEG